MSLSRINTGDEPVVGYLSDITWRVAFFSLSLTNSASVKTFAREVQPEISCRAYEYPPSL